MLPIFFHINQLLFKVMWFAHVLRMITQLFFNGECLGYGSWQLHIFLIRYSHSPDRLPTPERGPLNPIPENRQLPPGYREQSGNFYETIGPSSPAAHRGPYQSGIYEALPPGPYQGYPNPAHAQPQQPYMPRGPRAATMIHPQRAVAPAYDMSKSLWCKINL